MFTNPQSAQTYVDTLTLTGDGHLPLDCPEAAALAALMFGVNVAGKPWDQARHNAWNAKRTAASKAAVAPTNGRLPGRPKLDWSKAKQIKVDALPAQCQAAYAKVQEARELVKAETEAFENAVKAAFPPPAGKDGIFGYRFGRIVMLVVDETAAKQSKMAQTDGSDLWS